MIKAIILIGLCMLIVGCSNNNVDYDYRVFDIERINNTNPYKINEMKHITILYYYPNATNLTINITYLEEISNKTIIVTK